MRVSGVALRVGESVIVAVEECVGLLVPLGVPVQLPDLLGVDVREGERVALPLNDLDTLEAADALLLDEPDWDELPLEEEVADAVRDTRVALAEGVGDLLGVIDAVMELVGEKEFSCVNDAEADAVALVLAVSDLLPVAVIVAVMLPVGDIVAVMLPVGDIVAVMLAVRLDVFVELEVKVREAVILPVAVFVADMLLVGVLEGVQEGESSTGDCAMPLNCEALAPPAPGGVTTGAAPNSHARLTVEKAYTPPRAVTYATEPSADSATPA